MYVTGKMKLFLELGEGGIKENDGRGKLNDNIL
jgi:hypothetical protein